MSIYGDNGGLWFCKALSTSRSRIEGYMSIYGDNGGLWFCKALSTSRSRIEGYMSIYGDNGGLWFCKALSTSVYDLVSMSSPATQRTTSPTTTGSPATLWSTPLTSTPPG